ncbi:MAG: substrate-binding domain-containing protein [Verrucomicrobiales bacterium]|nr:substrate-binding domain-containing protein [Verrucomicrobiales bacterium]
MNHLLNWNVKPRFGALLFSTSLLLAAGCGRNDAGMDSRPGGATRNAPPAKGTIALSVLTLTNPFFKQIGDSMTEEARKHGYDVLVVSGEFDVAKQQNQVKDFIVKKAAAIVLTPCDSIAIGPAIKEANDAGIPVFTADIACLAPGVKVVTHVATDNFGGGKEAARAVIEALGDTGGRVAIIDHKPVESCILRVKGFKEAIESHNAARSGGKIEIVADLPGGGVKDGGFRAAEDLLQAHPDLAAIFAINDPSALGARAAMEKAGKAGQIVLVGFDGSPEGKAAVKAGKLYASPIQFPDRIGVGTVQAIMRHFKGEALPPETLIPTALYRQADADKDPTVK